MKFDNYDSFFFFNMEIHISILGIYYHSVYIELYILTFIENIIWQDFSGEFKYIINSIKNIYMRIMTCKIVRPQKFIWKNIKGQQKVKCL